LPDSLQSLNSKKKNKGKIENNELVETVPILPVNSFLEIKVLL
jgi:hypothetical protein